MPLTSLSVFLLFGMLVHAEEQDSDCSGQNLANQNFSVVRLDNANFEKGMAKEAILANSDVRAVRIASTSIFQATMDGANLEKADISKNGNDFPRRLSG